MGPDDLKMLRETYRLSVENNKMLHKMRRAAFLHTIVWLLIYAALVLGPIWFYMAYLQAPVQQLVRTYDQAEGTGAQVQGQYQNFSNAVMRFLSHLPGIASTSSASSTPVLH